MNILRVFGGGHLFSLNTILASLVYPGVHSFKSCGEWVTPGLLRMNTSYSLELYLGDFFLLVGWLHGTVDPGGGGGGGGGYSDIFIHT